MMTGYSGTGKSGKVYHYYACNNFKRRKCKEKVVSKERSRTGWCWSAGSC